MIRVTDHIHVVTGQDQGRFPHAYAFLLKGSETVLIDTGIGRQHLLDLDREHKIDVLILSHSHPDHFRQWELLKDRRLLLPRETPDSVMDLARLAERFVATPEGAAEWMEVFAGGLRLEPLREPDGRFSNGQVLDFGPIQLEAIYAPGHLADHYCFFERRSGVLITTDIDFTGFGPWYGNPEADLKAFMVDVDKLASYSWQWVCSSHKPPLERSQAEERFSVYRQGFKRHRNMILELLDRPRSLTDLAASSPFYADRMPFKHFQYAVETQMTGKNLALMKEEGLIGFEDGLYFRTGASVGS